MYLLLSVAKRHGLIEAPSGSMASAQSVGYPWQNATASLKLFTPVSAKFAISSYPWQNATASLKHFGVACYCS